MDITAAQALVTAALWKKETGFDRVYTNNRQVTPGAMQTLGIHASQQGGVLVVEGYDNLAALRKAGADFANKDHYMLDTPRNR